MKYAMILILVFLASGCVISDETTQRDEEVEIEDKYLNLLEERLHELSVLDEAGDVDLILKSVGEIKVMLEECPVYLLEIDGFQDNLTGLYRELSTFELNVIISIGDVVLDEARSLR